MGRARRSHQSARCPNPASSCQRNVSQSLEREGRKERTAILGPVRPETQVELSKSDCVELGVQAPVRESGDVKGSGSITIEGPCGSIMIHEGAIIAHSHVHLTPEVAEIMGVQDKQHVSVEVLTERPITFRDVIVRVSDRIELSYAH